MGECMAMLLFKTLRTQQIEADSLQWPTESYGCLRFMAAAASESEARRLFW